MSADSREWEVDELADFAAGLLDGTPEGAAITERLQRDPAYARLHADLVHADDVVRAELAALPAATIPADVAAALDAALAAEGASIKAQPTAGPARLSPVVSIRRRPSWLMGGGAVAAGVAVLAAAAVGLGAFKAQKPSSGDSSATSAKDQRAPSAPGLAEGRDSEPAATEYRQDVLSVQIPHLLRERRPLASSPSELTGPPARALQRLADPAALADCVTALHGQGKPLAVDYARYAGAPAVVIVLPTAERTVVDVAVVGPDCGLSGADQRLRTTVTVPG